MIDCPEAVRRMWAYLDHALERSPSEEFETHLEEKDNNSKPFCLLNVSLKS